MFKQLKIMKNNIIIQRFPHLLYLDVIQEMEKIVDDIILKNGSAQLWFLEHDSVYTAGTSAKPEDLLSPLFPVIQTSRGGQYTYHGPGQLICYIMMPLQKKDIRLFITQLAENIILTLRDFGVDAYFDSENVGVWVRTKFGPKKIAAIGIRLKKWVTFHGFSLNICPNLDHFKGIIPCGIKDYGVTSLHDLGIFASREQVENAFVKHMKWDNV